MEPEFYVIQTHNVTNYNRKHAASPKQCRRSYPSDFNTPVVRQHRFKHDEIQCF